MRAEFIITTKENDFFTVRSLNVKGLVLNEHDYKQANTSFYYSGKHPVIYFVLGGSYKLRANGKKFICRSGMAILIYDQRAMPIEYNSKGTKTFSIELTPELLKREEAELPFLKTHVFAEDSVIHELMDNLYKEYKQHERGAEHEIEGFFLVILGLLERERVLPDNAKPKWLLKLLRYLYADAEEKKTLKHFADLVDMDEDYLSKEIQRYCNCKFHELKLHIMLRKGKALLKRKQLSIGDIAYLCGFAHASHFIRLFKERFRETPKHYREHLA